jgi:hypothetical protein
MSKRERRAGRVTRALTPLGPAGTVVDRTFAPSYYDGTAVEADLQAMHDLGYTVVRSALDICQAECIGSPGGGLSAPYLANIADFMRRALRIGLQVVFQSNDLPEGAFTTRSPSWVAWREIGLIGSE